MTVRAILPSRENPTGSLQSSYCSAASTLREKAEVIEPVQRFMDLFSGRMRTQADSGLARLEQQMMTEMILIFIALLATMGIIFYTRLGILKPLAELGSQVAGVTRGILPSRYGKATSNELEKLSEALALADAEKQQLLEKERIAKNEAERASQLKDEFLATLSHELRTPLNAILGWSQLILSGSMKEDDVRRGLETIERNARAQNKLIEDLLEMSSIISGKVRLDMQQLDVASLVDTAVESVRPTAQAKGVSPAKEHRATHWNDHRGPEPAPAGVLEPAFELDKIYSQRGKNRDPCRLVGPHAGNPD